MVICRNEKGEFSAVNETRDRGWWVPAGWVDPGESFADAARRETKEEAGIDVKVIGVLRVVFYAEPYSNTWADLKTEPDDESLGAQWMTVAEFRKQKHIRGHELIHWGSYIAEGGPVYPLALFTDEGARVRVPFRTDLDPVNQHKTKDHSSDEDADNQSK